MNLSAKARAYVLGGLFGVVFLLFLPQSYDLIFVKFIALAIAADAALFFMRSQPPPQVKKEALYVLLLPAWMAVSALFSKYPHAALAPLFSVLASCAIMFYFSSPAHSDKKTAAALLLYPGTAAVAAGALQFAFPGAFKSLLAFGADIPSTFGNPNFFAAFLCAMLPFYWFEAAASKGMRKTVFAMLYALASALVVATGSKAGMAAAFGLTFILVFSAINKPKIMAAAVAAAILILSAAAFFNQEKILKNESVFFRQNIWKGTLELIKANPLLGVGPGAFYIAFPVHRPHEVMSKAVQHSYEITYPENFVLQAAAETGVPGAVLLVILLVLLFRRVNAANRVFAYSLGTLLCVNLFGVDINYPPSMLFAAVCAGMIINTGNGATAAVESKVFSRATAASAFVISAALFYFVAAQASMIYLKKGAARAGARDWPAAQENFARAVTFNPFNVPAVYFLAGAVYDADPEKNAHESLALFSRLEELAPDYALAHYRKGRILMMESKLDPAALEYERMLAIDPYFKPAIKELAYIYLSKKENFSRAEGYVLRVLRDNGDDAELYNILGSIYFADKRAAEAIIAYKKAVDLAPHKDYYYNLGCVYFAIGKLKEAKEWLAKSGEASKDGGDARTMQIMRVISQYEKLTEFERGN